MDSDDSDKFAHCIGRVGLYTRTPHFVCVQLTARAPATNGVDEIIVRTKIFVARPRCPTFAPSSYVPSPPNAMNTPNIDSWFKDIDRIHGHRITSSSFLRHVVVVPSPARGGRRRRHGSAPQKHHEAIVIEGTMSDEIDDFWTGTNLDAVLADGETPAGEAPADEAPDEPAAKRQRSQPGE